MVVDPHGISTGQVAFQGLQLVAGRNGKIAEPVRGGTLGGVVFATPGSSSLLANVVALGSKAELIDDVSAPAVLVKPLTVAGDSAGGAT